MKNKKWKQFGKLTEQCYRNMIGAEKDSSCWEKAFELLMEIVREERQKEPNCFQEVYMLDEATDYKYDISEWLEDCLDETDMREEYEVLLGMCDTLLSLFAWPDYTGSDLKFRKSSVLEALGRNNEAVRSTRILFSRRSSDKRFFNSSNPVPFFAEICSV